MQFPACATRKRVVPDSDGNEVIDLSSPKRERMDVSRTPANGAPFIRIEQLVKHDVWDIQRKRDGAFVMKKLNDTDSGTSADSGATGTNVDFRVNPEQLGARPKVTVQMPKTNVFTRSTVNASKDVIPVRKENAVTITPVNAPNIFVPRDNRSTVEPTKTPKNENTINITAVPPQVPVTMKTVATPKKGVITINTATAPKKGAILINANPVSKKEVITISTKSSLQPANLTINTASTSSKRETEVCEATPNLNVRKHAVHDIWNIQKKENDNFATKGPIQGGGPSSSANSLENYIHCTSPPTYPEEVYRIQEMFPQVQLSVISDDLAISGSVESTIDNLLAMTLTLTPESKASSGLKNETLVVPSSHRSSTPLASPATQHVDKDASKQSAKTEKNTSYGKKNGSVIKIELLAKNEVWDIKRKDKEGFVMKKILLDGESQSQSSKRDDSVVCLDNSVLSSVEVIEEDPDDLLTDDIFVDSVPYVGIPEQANVPVKLMVFSQSERSPDSKKRAAGVRGEENVESSMEVDCFDKSHSHSEALVDTFDFSDDEIEESETIEHFLLKASLVLKRLKYINESENQIPSDSALLNITGGGQKTEDAGDDDAEMYSGDPCSDDDDDEFYTDETYTDEED